MTKKVEIDEMQSIASGVSKGHMGMYFTYCIEEKQFYEFGNGYWKKIFELELLARVSMFSEFYYMNNYTITRRKQVIENLKLLINKRLEFFNANGWLNFDLGAFDPVALEMHDHDKEHYSTMRIPYPHHKSAECPIWVKTLNDILENNQNKIDTLQEFFGYCLTSKNNQKMALLLLGDSDSGKSTILFALREMVGNFNCSFVQLKDLSNLVHLTALMNKLVNIDADVAKDAASYEAQFKLITSNEPIRCNPKYVTPFDFLPGCKMIMAANIFPKITDHSSAFYNRLIIIPCDRIFKKSEQDKELWPKLKEELPGIFNWACIGLRELTQRGFFEEKEFIREAVKELEDDNNPSNAFFDEHIVFDNHSYEEKSELFKKYIQWCKDTNVYQLSAILFGKSLFKRFPLVDKKSRLPNSGPRIFKNIKYVHFKTDVLAPGSEEIIWQEK